MAFSQADLDIAEKRVADQRERVAASQARLMRLVRDGAPTEEAEAEHHALVEALGRHIDHVAAARLSVARRRRDQPPPLRRATGRA
jgi:hypothetical protein